MVRTTKKSKKIKILINYHITINFYLATATEKNFDNSKGFNFFVSKHTKSNTYSHWIKRKIINLKY